jgi:glycosyltransferase involved in cell wall biosynthesis
MSELRFISVVIPVHNESATIRAALEAALSSDYERFEVIVVDDRSTDGSLEIIKGFPCKLICMEHRAGASGARNAGARAASGDVLFFTDADCLLLRDTLRVANETINENPGAIVSGTYTVIPADTDFYGCFQSVLVHYFETRRTEPDYVAAHSMVIETDVFRRTGGFVEKGMLGEGAGVEDVELSHRLRKSGHKLVMNPHILVRHIFGFNLTRSLRNAWNKSLRWTLYSITNGDLLADSGSASVELKYNVFSFLLSVFAVICGMLSTSTLWLVFFSIAQTFNLLINRRVVLAFLRSGQSMYFAVGAVLNYFFIYPAPVAAGVFVAVTKHFLLRCRGRREAESCILP